MKALVYDKSLQFKEIPVPVPGKDEALIKIHLAGICNTDLEILQGYMKFKGIPGHEFVGEVVASPEKEWIGKRVVGEINIGCGQCRECRDGIPNHCADREVLGILKHNGVFAEYCCIPVFNLHEVPDSVPDEIAVWTEPLAAACEITEQISVHPQDKIAVIGDGKLAQLCARVVHRTGCSLTVFGKHQEKLALLKDLSAEMRCGRDPALSSHFDIVIEASGKPEGFQTAMDLVRPRGTIVLKSTTHHKTGPSMNPLVIHEITLTGSRCGPFQPALRLLKEKHIQPAPLITEIVPFMAWEKAFSRAKLPESLKIVLDMRQEI